MAVVAFLMADCVYLRGRDRSAGGNPPIMSDLMMKDVPWPVAIGSILTETA